MILHGIAVAAVSFSVESVLESIVSRYEEHFDMDKDPQRRKGFSGDGGGHEWTRHKPMR